MKKTFQQNVTIKNSVTGTHRLLEKMSPKKYMAICTNLKVFFTTGCALNWMNTLSEELEYMNYQQIQSFSNSYFTCWKNINKLSKKYTHSFQFNKLCSQTYKLL